MVAQSTNRDSKSPDSFKSPSNGIEVNDSVILALKDKLDFLDEGCDKTVFALDKDHVLKIGREQVLSECEVWEQVKDTPDCVLFAAIYAYGIVGDTWPRKRYWSVQERCLPLQVTNEQAHILMCVLEEQYGLSDWIPQNLGLDKEGNIKAIDYAQ